MQENDKISDRRRKVSKRRRLFRFSRKSWRRMILPRSRDSKQVSKNQERRNKSRSGLSRGIDTLPVILLFARVNVFAAAPLELYAIARMEAKRRSRQNDVAYRGRQIAAGKCPTRESFRAKVTRITSKRSGWFAYQVFFRLFVQCSRVGHGGRWMSLFAYGSRISKYSFSYENLSVYAIGSVVPIRVHEF